MFAFAAILPAFAFDFAAFAFSNSSSRCASLMLDFFSSFFGSSIFLVLILAALEI